MKPLRTHWCCAVVALSFLLPAGVASAQTDEETERGVQLYQNGSKLYEEGSYAAAAKAFMESYELTGEPALLFNVANAYERMGELDLAIQYLDEYRIYASPEEADALERRLAVLERRRTDAAAAKLAAREAEAQGPGNATGAAASTTRLQLDRPSPAPWIVLGVGGAAAAALGVTAGVTYSQGQQHIADNEQGPYDALKPTNNAALVGASIAGGAALAGLIGGLIDAGTRSSSKKARVSGFASPQGVALTLRW